MNEATQLFIENAKTFFTWLIKTILGLIKQIIDMIPIPQWLTVTIVIIILVIYFVLKHKR